MSLHMLKIWSAVCDGCMESMGIKTESREWAIKDVIAEGWVWRKGRLLCPECQDKVTG